MGMFKLKPFALGLCFLGGAVLLISRAGFSDALSDNSANISATDLDKDVPVSFNVRGGANLSKIYVSCFNPAASLVGTFQGALSGGGAGSVPSGFTGAATACPGGGDSIKDVDDVGCSNFKEGKNYNQKKMDKFINTLNKDKETLNCKKNKLQAIQGELQCLSRNANTLTSQITNLQSAYINNLQRMQGDTNTLREIIDDRRKQKADIEEKLNGNPKKGLGLNQMKLILESVVNGMPTAIQGIKNQQEELAQHERVLESGIESYKMALVSQCYQSQPGPPDYKCEKTGTTIETPLAFTKCRYEQNSKLDDRQRVDTSGFKKGVAKSDQASLTSVLTSILSQMPNVPIIPKEVTNVLDQPKGISSLQDLERKYGRMLRALNGGGLDIYKAVMTDFTNCYKKSKDEVDRMRASTGSSIRISQDKIKNTRENISAQVNTLLNGYGKHYLDTFRALIDQHVSLDVRSCKNVPPEGEVKCLVDTQPHCEEMLFRYDPARTSGPAPATPAMRIFIPGGKVPRIELTCLGVNGCITAYGSALSQLDSEIQNVRTYRQNYINKANQLVRFHTNMMISQLRIPSKRLNDEVKNLNLALGSLGVKGALKFSPVPSEELEQEIEKEFDAQGREFDTKGLIRPPKSILNVVSSQISPPLLNISEDGFSSVGIGEATEKLEESLNKVKQLENKLPGLRETCIDESLEKDIENLVNKVTEAENACDLTEFDCGDQSAVRSLLKVLNDLDESSSAHLDGSDLSGLASGILRKCPDDKLGEEDGSDATGLTPEESDRLTKKNNQKTKIEKLKELQGKLEDAGVEQNEVNLQNDLLVVAQKAKRDAEAVLSQEDLSLARAQTKIDEFRRQHPKDILPGHLSGVLNQAQDKQLIAKNKVTEANDAYEAAKAKAELETENNKTIRTSNSNIKNIQRQISALTAQGVITDETILKGLEDEIARLEAKKQKAETKKSADEDKSSPKNRRDLKKRQVTCQGVIKEAEQKASKLKKKIDKTESSVSSKSESY